jgi:hypothetical protein
MKAAIAPRNPSLECVESLKTTVGDVVCSSMASLVASSQRPPKEGDWVAAHTLAAHVSPALGTVRLDGAGHFESQATCHTHCRTSRMAPSCNGSGRPVQPLPRLAAVRSLRPQTPSCRNALMPLIESRHGNPCIAIVLPKLTTVPMSPVRTLMARPQEQGMHGASRRPL